MNALVMGTLKAQQRGGQNGRRDKGDQAPQQIAGSRCRAKKVTQEKCEATLGATSAAGQRNGGAQQLDKGARGHDREKVDFVVAKGEHQKVRNQVEKRQLQHGDDNCEQHGRKMAGREFEFLGKRVDLAIDKGAPALDLCGRDATRSSQLMMQ